MRAIAVLVLAASVTPVLAQVEMRATDPPLVTAANESWFVLGEPVQFSGDLYVRQGAEVFFNGNTMARVGHYNGVPLYADTTVEPFSVILVPATRGLMQPYVKARLGVRTEASGYGVPSPIAMAPTAPTSPPMPIGAISVYTPDVAPARAAPMHQIGGTTGLFPLPLMHPGLISVRRPEGNDGIWIRFHGQKWASSGTSVSALEGFERVGEYSGLPVFRRSDYDEPVIYLPTAGGRFAPFYARQ